MVNVAAKFLRRSDLSWMRAAFLLPVEVELLQPCEKQGCMIISSLATELKPVFFTLVLDIEVYHEGIHLSEEGATLVVFCF